MYHRKIFHDFHDFRKVLVKYWKSIPVGDKIVKKLDSPLLKIKEFAVNDWIKSNKKLHTMRDHPQHLIVMLVGIWYFPNKVYKTFSRLLLKEILDHPLTYNHIYYGHACNCCYLKFCEKYYMVILYNMMHQHSNILQEVNSFQG